MKNLDTTHLVLQKSKSNSQDYKSTRKIPTPLPAEHSNYVNPQLTQIKDSFIGKREINSELWNDYDSVDVYTKIGKKLSGEQSLVSLDFTIFN